MGASCVLGSQTQHGFLWKDLSAAWKSFHLNGVLTVFCFKVELVCHKFRLDVFCVVVWFQTEATHRSDGRLWAGIGRAQEATLQVKVTLKVKQLRPKVSTSRDPRKNLETGDEMLEGFSQENSKHIKLSLVLHVKTRRETSQNSAWCVFCTRMLLKNKGQEKMLPFVSLFGKLHKWAWLSPRVWRGLTFAWFAWIKSGADVHGWKTLSIVFERTVPICWLLYNFEIEELKQNFAKEAT